LSGANQKPTIFSMSMEERERERGREKDEAKIA
jgi:hypothetical protein